MDPQHSRFPAAAGLLAAAALLSPVAAQVPVAQLDALFPPGAQAGQSLTVSPTGQNLEELSSVWVSDPEITGSIENGQVRLEIPEGLSPRMVDVSVGGRFGVSNPRAFAVGAFPEVRETGDHKRREQAQVMEVGQTMNGTADATAIDWYQITPSSTEPIVIDVLAERIDSRMDSTLMILDERGRELARHHDVRGRDVTTTFVPPKPNEPLFIGIHDFLYEGGASHYYRLTVASELPETRYPARILADLSAVTLAGEATPFQEGLTITSLPTSIAGNCAFDARPTLDFTAKVDGAVVAEVFSERLGDSSDFRLWVDRVAEDDKLSRAGESDDLGDPINNKRYRLGSRDSMITFDAKAGGRYRISLRNQFRTGGQFRLELRHPQPDVDLVAAAEKPREQGNQLTRWVPVLRRGGTIHYEILALRRDGFAGPITVRAENLPEGVTAPDLLIGRGHHSGALTLTAGAEAPAFSGPIEIIGEWEIDGETRKERARGASLLWSIGDANRERWESRLTWTPLLTVLEQETEPITLATAETALKTCLGAKLELPFTINRLHGQAGNFKMSLYGLPGLKKSPEVSFNPKATEVKLTLDLANKNNNKFEPGSYVIHARAWEGKVKHRTNPEAAERAEAERKEAEEKASQLAAKIKELEEKKVTEVEIAEAKKQLEAANQSKDAAAKKAEEAKKRAAPRDLNHAFLSPPLHLTIDDGPLKFESLEAIALAPGNESESKFKIERLFGFAEAVEFTLSPPKDKKLFEPVKASLAKEASEIVLKIPALAEAPAGAFEAVLEAKFKFHGQDLSMQRSVSVNVVASDKTPKSSS